MSDGQTLFALVVLLYLSECLIWIGKHTIVFVAPWGKSWQVKYSNALLGNAYGGISLANPLMPFVRPLSCHLLPVSVSPVGICAYNLQSLPTNGRPLQSGVAVTFDKITSAAHEGRNLQVNKGDFIECLSADHAQSLAQLINAAIPLTRSERKPLIESFINQEFDQGEAASILARSRNITQPLEFVCSTFFVILFFAIPALVVLYGLVPLFVPIAGTVIGFAILTGVMFFRAHRMLYPALREERTIHLAKIILCPPAAIRAVDIMTANLLGRFSPIVVANLVSISNKETFVRSFLCDLKYPLSHDLSDPLSIEIIEWCASQRFSRCVEYLQRHQSIDLATIFTPETKDFNCQSYCPRCGCQFSMDRGDCPDCLGVELLAFQDHPETGNRADI